MLAFCMAFSNTSSYSALLVSIDTVPQPLVKVITYVITGNSTLHHERISQTGGDHVTSFPSTAVEDDVRASRLRALSFGVVYRYHVV